MPGFTTSTGTQNQQTQQSGTQTANLNPLQQQMQGSIFQQLMAMIQGKPAPVSQAQRDADRSQINTYYDQAGKTMQSNLAARGFQNPTGKLGKGFEDLTIARGNAISASDASEQTQANQRLMQTLGLGLAFDQPLSYSSTSSGTSSGQSSSTPSPMSSLGEILAMAFA